MDELSLLRDFVVIFGAAIGINFLFHRLQIAPIAGYLIAGVLLGPSVLGVVKDAGFIEVLAQDIAILMGTRESIARMYSVELSHKITAD